MTLAAAMLAADALRAVDGGVEVDVGLSWYRSLPLSSVQAVELTIAGEHVAPEELRFTVNGHEYALGELPSRWDELWFVLDPATLRVPRPLVAAGEETEVTVRMVKRIPYILIGPDRPLEHATSRTRTLTAR